MFGYGKMIALRGNLYHFHDLPNQDFSNYIVAINHILKNGTAIDLKVDKPYDGSDSDVFMMPHIQLVPFSRRFFENVKNDGLNLEHTKFD